MILALSYMFLVKVLCSTFWRYKYLYSTTTNIQYIYFLDFQKIPILLNLSPSLCCCRELESKLRTKVRKIGIPLVKGPIRYSSIAVSSASQDICVIFISNGVQSCFQTGDVYNLSPHCTALWTDCTIPPPIFSSALICRHNPAQPSPVQSSPVQLLWENDSLWGSEFLVDC